MLRRRKAGLQSEGPPSLLQSSLIMAGHVEIPSNLITNDERKRIDLLGQTYLPQCFFRPAHGGKMIRIPMMRRGEIGFEVDGLAVFRFGARPIPVAEFLDVG